MQRILGIDYGEARIGLALSDELGLIAHPLETMEVRTTEPARRIGEIAKREKVALLVLGMPRNMDGSYGPAAEKVREFIAKLEGALTVPIRTWDERLTSAQANRMLIAGNVRRQDRKQVVDKMAAAILLQSFLDTLQ